MNINQKEEKSIGWNFDNTYASLSEKFYTKQDLNPVVSPSLVVLNNDLAESLGLNIKALNSLEGIAVLAGNIAPKGALPITQAYSGHQFGYFTMLGDGRALLLGEHITPGGNRFDIQLKGSGRTPFSRGGDGRAALGPMLREYIISEAMDGLGIPTTRSLAVVSTGEKIIRDTVLPGAILTRVAQSHIRFGTFQYISKYGSEEDLKELADYTIKRHFPSIENEKYKYILFLKEVIKRQAKLVAKWQVVGFIHGVMNTDNMLISGETIDYGPCAFMDTYDPETVFSSIDTYGRYAYGNQPTIAVWNLSRFAETLLPLIDDDIDEALKIANKAIADFSQIYDKLWKNGMRKKLGMLKEESEDESIIVELLSIMKKYKSDFTNTFRALTLGDLCEDDLFLSDEFKLWKEKWDSRLNKEEKSKEDILHLMKENNPAVIPRNHRVEEALDAAVTRGDYGVMDQLLKVLANPYEYSIQQKEYTTLPPKSNKPYRTFCGT
ncbi:MAG: YdiU family protein [Tissierellaceae bacterium]|nr:YdiU family protein [Tissierellaceae bacterium]